MTDKQGYQFLSLLMFLMAIFIGTLAYGKCSILETIGFMGLPLFVGVIMFILGIQGDE